MNKLRFAILGFRHGHITDLARRLKEHPAAELVGAAEDDVAAREATIASGVCPVAFDSCEKLLDTVDCDAVGIGDYYGRRGSLALEALRRGKHVISDKPICTRLSELEEIARLSREKGLCVGCQLDMRDSGAFRAARRRVREGDVGEVHAVTYGGQHPLMYGSRAGWYFEEGKHGGTINDIAIHAMDSIPWITGHEFAVIHAARNWNAGIKAVPHFKDAAQVMMSLRNGCGVLGDVSYLMPDSFGYGLPQYWRTTFWGSQGTIECSATAAPVVLYRNGDKAPRSVPPEPATPGGYLESFLKDVRGERAGLELTTAVVLRASRVALLAQEAADRGLTNVEIGF